MYPPLASVSRDITLLPSHITAPTSTPLEVDRSTSFTATTPGAAETRLGAHSRTAETVRPLIM